MAGDPKGSERGRGSLCPTPPPGGCASLSLGLRQSPSSVCPCALLRKPPRAGTAEPVLAQLLGGPQLQLPGLCGHPLQVRPTTGGGAGQPQGETAPGSPLWAPLSQLSLLMGGCLSSQTEHPKSKQPHTAPHGTHWRAEQACTAAVASKTHKQSAHQEPPPPSCSQVWGGGGGIGGGGTGAPKALRPLPFALHPLCSEVLLPTPQTSGRSALPAGGPGELPLQQGGSRLHLPTPPAPPRPRLGQGPLSCSPVLPPSPANSL